jgi:hypothetical protein
MPIREYTAIIITFKNIPSFNKNLQGLKVSPMHVEFLLSSYALTLVISASDRKSPEQTRPAWSQRKSCMKVKQIIVNVQLTA